MYEEQDLAKQNVAKKAVELVEDGMIIGLGSGSTARYFIQELIKRCQAGLKIRAVSSSVLSAKIALKGNIPLVNEAEFLRVDLYIDGADEVDPKKNLIKGGGGNLLREKIVATSSHEMVVIIDEKKLVPQLGHFGLPVEIVPFGYQSTIQRIKDLGFKGQLRMTQARPYITDNGNYILDIVFYPVCQNPRQDNEKLLSIAGVVETGFFFDIAGRVLIGYNDGRVEIKNNFS